MFDTPAFKIGDSVIDKSTGRFLGHVYGIRLTNTGYEFSVEMGLFMDPNWYLQEQLDHYTAEHAKNAGDCTHCNCQSAKDCRKEPHEPHDETPYACENGACGEDNEGHEETLTPEELLEEVQDILNNAGWEIAVFGPPHEVILGLGRMFKKHGYDATCEELEGVYVKYAAEVFQKEIASVEPECDEV